MQSELTDEPQLINEPENLYESILCSLGTLDDYDSTFCDEACLDRYLSSCKGDTQKVASRLKSTLQWRKEFRPDAITISEMEPFLQAGLLRFAGKDTSGRPVLVFQPREEPNNGTQNAIIPMDNGLVKYFVFTIETLIRSMDRGVDQFVWILNFSGGSSIKTAPGASDAGQEILKICQNHYLERLAMVYIIDAPAIFVFFYQIVSWFLDTETNKKIKFFSMASFLKDIENQQQNLGHYNGFEDYYQFLDKDYPIEEYMKLLENIGWPLS